MRDRNAIGKPAGFRLCWGCVAYRAGSNLGFQDRRLWPLGWKATKADTSEGRSGITATNTNTKPGQTLCGRCGAAPNAQKREGFAHGRPPIGLRFPAVGKACK
jgi:hypothetical protein